MNILVTGGTGFLGRHVVWRLAQLGHDVTFTGRQSIQAERVIKSASKAVRFVRIEHGEPESKALLTDAANGMSAMVHCAALSSPWGHSTAFYKANVASTIEVIAACESNQVARLVHISTPSVYFDFEDKLNIREDSQIPPPVNEYARTKMRAELLLNSASIPEMIVLRPRAIFGPWDNTLMPRLLRVIEQGAVPLMRGGHARMDLTYVDNVVDAIALALFEPPVRQLSTYNVTNGEPYTFSQLLSLVTKKFNLPVRTRRMPWWLVSSVARLLEAIARTSRGQEPVITRYSAGVLAFSQTLCIDSIRDELGYRPRVTIEQGLSLHAAWYASQTTNELP